MSLDKEQLFRKFGEGLLDDRLSKAIAKLGYIHPTLIQAKMIPIALRGRDVLARARTGSGKTFAYAIPVLQKILKVKNENDVRRSQGKSGRSGSVQGALSSDTCSISTTLILCV